MIKKDAIHITYFGRFGNSVRQMLNALHIRKFTGIEKIYMPNLWYVNTDVDFIFRNNEIAFLSENSNILTHDFFKIHKVGVDITRDLDYREIYLENRNIFLFNERVDHQVSDNDLVIYFRSGDIFENNIHIGYGQPPFEFYRKIIHERIWDTIYCVYENMSNPVIGKLIQYLSLNNINYKCISGSLESDVAFLLKSINLVIAPGTFTWAISVISDNIKNIYHFDNLNDRNIYPKNLNYIGLYDKKQLYVNSIMRNNWFNSEEQIQMMLTYNINNIDYKDKNQ